MFICHNSRRVMVRYAYRHNKLASPNWQSCRTVYLIRFSKNNIIPLSFFIMSCISVHFRLFVYFRRDIFTTIQKIKLTLFVVRRWLKKLAWFRRTVIAFIAASWRHWTMADSVHIKQAFPFHIQRFIFHRCFFCLHDNSDISISWIHFPLSFLCTYCKGCVFS